MSSAVFAPKKSAAIGARSRQKFRDDEPETMM
jgi:hypothetical protein